MQKIQVQNTQNHSLSAKASPTTSGPLALTGSSNTTGVTSTGVSGLFGPHTDLPISDIALTLRIEPSMLAGYILPQFGNLLAITLAKVLDELEKNNREAIDPIIAILEPYMETDRDVKVNIRPKSTREITLKITRLGKVTHKIHLDESLM